MQIAEGENSYSKTHPIMQKFAMQVGDNSRIFLHAEVQCLLRSKDTVVHKITVERYTQDKNPAMARPCKICMQALKFFGVKEVEYTTENGWKKENIE